MVEASLIVLYKAANESVTIAHTSQAKLGHIANTVKPNEFLQKLGRVKFWRTHGERAPHKPLLVLLALARVAQGRERLARYEDDIEPPLTDLLKRFGPPAKQFILSIHSAVWEETGCGKSQGENH